MPSLLTEGAFTFTATIGITSCTTFTKSSSFALVLHALNYATRVPPPPLPRGRRVPPPRRVHGLLPLRDHRSAPCAFRAAGSSAWEPRLGARTRTRTASRSTAPRRLAAWAMAALPLPKRSIGTREQEQGRSFSFSSFDEEFIGSRLLGDDDDE